MYRRPQTWWQRDIRLSHEICLHNCSVNSQQTRLRICKYGILVQAYRWETALRTLAHQYTQLMTAITQQCMQCVLGLKTHLMSHFRSAAQLCFSSSTYYLSKLILWWCIPPALPRPPGCFLCLPARVDNTPLAHIHHNCSGYVTQSYTKTHPRDHVRGWHVLGASWSWCVWSAVQTRWRQVNIPGDRTWFQQSSASLVSQAGNLKYAWIVSSAS